MEPDCPCALDWQIDNLAVCVVKATDFNDTAIYSSHLTEDHMPACEPSRGFPQPVPARSWSAQRVSSACAGTASVCVRLRAGEPGNPAATDCTIATHCAQFEYTEAHEPLELPALPAWSFGDAACGEAYEAGGGYLEFWTEGGQLGCGEDANAVKRVAVCPLGCFEDPNGPGCDVCDDQGLITSF